MCLQSPHHMIVVCSHHTERRMEIGQLCVVIHRALSTLTTLKDRAKKWAFKNTYLVYTSYLSYMKRYLFHSASSKRTITQCIFGAIFGSEFFSFSTCPLQFSVALANLSPIWRSPFCTAP